VHPLFDLSARVALVTGASSGIGRAIATGLASAGAAVVLAARDRDRLAQAEREIADRSGRSATVAVDLLVEGAVEELAQAAAAAFGAPGILVNAAGVNLRQPVDQITRESWSRTLDLNLGVPFFLARSLVPAMRAGGWGRIINIASLQSRRAFPNGLPYGASKGGVTQLTRAMAEAWSCDGINCNAIGPGFFPTPLTAPVFDDPQLAAQAAAQTASGRNGRLEDLHGVAIFLAAPASDYITGQTIFVDGGFTAK